MELLEDDLSLFGRDARPGVAHGDAETAVGRAPGLDVHLARVRELHRVPDEVDEDLPDTLAVENDRGRRSLIPPREAEALLRGQ